MSLTAPQLQTLKTNLAANTSTVLINGAPTAIKDVPHSGDFAQIVADWYNLVASPSYWLWYKEREEEQITQKVSADATSFIWAGNGFISRTVTELMCWDRLFRSGSCSPYLANVRQAFADIFSGAGNAAANRAHLLAICRRLASNLDNLFAIAVSGPGNDGGTRGTSTNPDSTPDNFGDVNLLTYQEVVAAWELT